MRFKAAKGGYGPRPRHGEVLTLENMGEELAALSASNHSFGYLFEALAKDPGSVLAPGAVTISALRKLGAAMTAPAAVAPSSIPAGMTYLGQFIDHDITLDVQSDALQSIEDDDFSPLDPDDAIGRMMNARTATLDLDSVYGGGPTESPELYENPTDDARFDGVLLRIGVNAPTNVPDHISVDVRDRDLPRDEGGQAIIGDARNDENLLVAQTHLAFLRFHNAVAVRLADTTPAGTLFEAARKVVRQHYQWLILREYLPAICKAGVVERIEARRRVYGDELATFMPFEFAVAAYRFGHSLVRQTYNHNSIFPSADFALMFRFTGKTPSAMPLPQNWIIDWRRFHDFDQPATNRARRVDTRLALELDKLPGSPPNTILARLAQRNLLRGYLFSLPTGQAVANALGAAPLSADELSRDASEAELSALREGGFSEKTPLWYYALKESEVREDGQTLGFVGSTLVAETLIALLRRSEDSILTTPSWTPTLGSGGDFRMHDLLQIAGVA